MPSRRPPRAARALLLAALSAAAACVDAPRLRDLPPDPSPVDTAPTVAAWAERFDAVVLVGGAPPWLAVVFVSGPPLPRPPRPVRAAPDLAYLDARFGESR